MVELAALAMIVGVMAVGAIMAKRRKRRRARYAKEVTSKGWEFVNEASIAHTYGLTVPPFGRGFDRIVDDLIRGRTSNGVWFQAMTYKSDEYCGKVLTARLPAPLPELHILAADRPRHGVRLPPLRGFQPLWVASPQPEFAREVLGSIRREIMIYGRNYPLNLTIDGQHLVAINLASDQPKDIATAAEALAAVVNALPSSIVERYRQPEPVAEFSFYKMSGWHYWPVRDEILVTVKVAGRGANHHAEHVVTCDNRGLPFVAFVHHWQTVDTDRSGMRDHFETVLEFALPFRTPAFSLCYDSSAKTILNLFRPLPEIDFESDEFNAIFDIRCASQRFAYDVVHPKQLEYLKRTRPPAFYWGGGIARFQMRHHDPDAIAWVADFFYGFLQRVPSFVWKDLRLPPPVPELPQR